MMSSRGSLAALVAAALTAGVALFYLLLIGGQEDTSVGDSRVLFLAGCLAAAAVCAAIGGLIPDGLLRVVLLAAAGSTLLAWTFLGALSIGFLLLLPTILTIRSAAHAAAAVADKSSYGIAAAAGFAALAIVAIGLAST